MTQDGDTGDRQSSRPLPRQSCRQTRGVGGGEGVGGGGKRILDRKAKELYKRRAERRG